MTMKALCRTSLAALMLAAAWQPTLAVSFDCTKAEVVADEKTVCADCQPNDEDVEMSVHYIGLKPLLSVDVRGDLNEAQVAWLKRRAGCRDDRVCLSKTYAARLLQLIAEKGSFDALVKRGPL